MKSDCRDKYGAAPKTSLRLLWLLIQLNRNWLSREFNSCDQNLHRRQNKLKCFIFNTNANSGMLSTQLCYTVTCPQCSFGIAVDWDYCWLGVTYSTPTKWESDLGKNIMFSTITVSQRWMESRIWWSQVEGEWIKTKLITGFREDRKPKLWHIILL